MKDIVRDTAPKRIKHIQFTPLTPQQIVQISEFEAIQRDLYTFPDRLPVRHGVLDKRLGTSDKAGVCETCGLKMSECVGHYAFVRLVLPVFHIGFFKPVITILQTICKTCSRVLLPPTRMNHFLPLIRRPNLPVSSRRSLASTIHSEARKTLFCPYCHALNGIVKKGPAPAPSSAPGGGGGNGLKIIHERFRPAMRKRKGVGEVWEDWRMSLEWSVKGAEEGGGGSKEMEAHLDKAEEDLNPLRVLTIFRKIPPADVELLGLNPDGGRPEDFIWQYVHVPPVCIRPSVAQDGATNEDDLTVKLTEIIFTNALIKAGLSKGTTASTLMEQWDFLQLCVALYINAEAPGMGGGHGHKPIRGLCQRLKGKQGRFRGNLSGKRVDFSSRTVISPDPNLRVDEVAVPVRVAKILTYPERVTPHNLARLADAVRNGPDNWPGANFLQNGSVSAGGPVGMGATVGAGEVFKRYLKYGRRDEIAKKLKIGDVVERHLVDGDVVLFNRQPSLHKLSILSHNAKIRPWRTFRFNECVCAPYNADFDGDEMNLHVPQTEESRSEAQTLLNIKQNLVTPRNGEPIIAATQDFLTASFLISRRDTFFDRQEFTQILGYMSDANDHIDLPPPCILRPVYLWSGKQVFNCLMRPNKSSPVLVNVESKCATHEKAPADQAPDMSPNDGYLVVQNSEVMCGVMDKATVGGGKKFSIFGVMMRDYGSEEAAKAMNKLAKLAARFLANKGFSVGINDVTPGQDLQAHKDTLIAAAYVESTDLINKSRSGKLENQPGCDVDQTLEAVISGVLSKVRGELGDKCMVELSRHNTPLIMATCGSKGNRVNVAQMAACVGQQVISGNRVPDGFQDRSLPHFPKHSKEPPSKGFVRNSFFSGLTATEFFFHAISGREGLVDTAVKTAETGYMQRRLMKALEDLSTRYDLSVRNSNGGVVQFMYGDDGLDPAHLEGDAQPIDFARTWRHTRAITPHTVGLALLPYQIALLLRHFLSDHKFTQALSGAYIESIRRFTQQEIILPAAAYREGYGLPALLEEPTEAEKAGKKKKMGKVSAAQIAIVNNKTRVTDLQICRFLKLCQSKYVRCKVEPGTAVGAVGAQSIGEPGTQMTLKTFHFAGLASMNITLGVPRIKEIINAAKAISTPIIDARLVAENSERAARIVKARIEKTFLGDIATFVEDCYHTHRLYLSVHIDMEAIQRLQLEITLDSIRTSIIAAPKLKIDPGCVHISAKKSRIRIYAEPAKSESQQTRLMALRRGLVGVVVKGYPNLSRAVIKVDKGRQHLLVEGYGLRQVMTTDGIVGTHTTSNHVDEVYKVLGIEAARATIINQISYTMREHGLTVDPRHMMLLGDVMCYKGEVLGITRFGVAKMKDSVLMLASFEKTTDHLFDSSLYSKRDAIAGVSECIIMGSPANNCGTAMPALATTKPDIPKPRKLLFEDYTKW